MGKIPKAKIESQWLGLHTPSQGGVYFCCWNMLYAIPDRKRFILGPTLYLLVLCACFKYLRASEMALYTYAEANRIVVLMYM